MKRGYWLAAFLLACGETVSLGDGVHSRDAATDSAGGTTDVASGGASGSAGFHDSGAVDSAQDHPAWDGCAGRLCNEPCHVCDPADPQCIEPPEPHRCDDHGTCTPHSVTCS